MNTEDKMIIFEVANNHNGSLDHGKLIVDEIKEISDKFIFPVAVKFQLRDLDSLLHPDFLDKDLKYFERFKKTRLPIADMLKLFKYVKDNGLILICTPFDNASLKYMGMVDFIKIASCSNDDWPLLEEIAELGKPVIASTGGLDFDGIDNLVNFFKHKNIDLSLLHCVGKYPMNYEDARLYMIPKMIKRYGITIGYSGHEGPNEVEVGMMAMGMGAEIFERHYGSGSVNDYSLQKESAINWLHFMVKANNIIGYGQGADKEEIETLNSLKRGTYLARDYDQFDDINEVFYAMPLQYGQVSAGKYGEYRTGYIADRNLKAGEPLVGKRYFDIEIEKARKIIHRAEGMIAEAGIKLKNYSVEISHHYGIMEFDSYGAVIFSILNREYCKKLIVMFSGQTHPSHYHKLKEEMFHVLWGGLIVDVNDRKFDLEAGDVKLIERYHDHSFYTKSGVIFEEISTTHISGDSYYSDMTIVKSDILERKTIIT